MRQSLAARADAGRDARRRGATSPGVRQRDAATPLRCPRPLRCPLSGQGILGREGHLRRLRLVTPRVCDPHGRKLETCIDWIAPTFLVTLVSLPAGLAEDGRPVGLQIVVPRSRSR
jgi:hypothetical protein